MNQCPCCRSAINFAKVLLTCGVCRKVCCEQCGTPYENQILCKECAHKYRQINLLPEPPEDEEDF